MRETSDGQIKCLAQLFLTNDFPAGIIVASNELGLGQSNCLFTGAAPWDEVKTSGQLTGIGVWARKVEPHSSLKLVFQTWGQGSTRKLTLYEIVSYACG